MFSLSDYQKLIYVVNITRKVDAGLEIGEPKIEISASPISGGAMPSVQSPSAMREPNSTPECIYETHREIQVSEINPRLYVVFKSGQNYLICGYTLSL